MISTRTNQYEKIINSNDKILNILSNENITNIISDKLNFKKL
jgi:hypothetical protein